MQDNILSAPIVESTSIQSEKSKEEDSHTSQFFKTKYAVEDMRLDQKMPSEKQTRSVEELRRQWRAEFENELAESRTREARLERELANLRATRKEELLLNAIRPWAIDVDAVLSMIQAHLITNSDGELQPVNANGERLMDGEQPVTLASYLNTFRETKPYLVKATAIAGTGSYSDSQGNKSQNSLAELAELPMAQFIQAGGI